jgi:hypothetical protein
MRFIQVTTEQYISKKRRDLASVPWDIAHESVEVWSWKKGTRGAKSARDGGRCFTIFRLDDDYASRTTLGPIPRDAFTTAKKAGDGPVRPEVLTGVPLSATRGHPGGNASPQSPKAGMA